MYVVVVYMKEVGVHHTFVPAFAQFCQELTAIQKKGGLNAQTVAMCWIERKWPTGSVPAYFEDIKVFGMQHGLIHDGLPVIDPPEIDERTVEQFYFRLHSPMSGSVLNSISERVQNVLRTTGIQ